MNWLTDIPGSITVEELKERLDQGEKPFLLDVREPEERAISSLGGILIPMGDLVQKIGELEANQEIIVYCHHGIRSRNAVAFLRDQGFSKARNLTGGIDRWALIVDPQMPRY